MPGLINKCNQAFLFFCLLFNLPVIIIKDLKMNEENEKKRDKIEINTTEDCFFSLYSIIILSQSDLHMLNLHNFLYIISVCWDFEGFDFYINAHNHCVLSRPKSHK
jgi:hypothetical protein